MSEVISGVPELAPGEVFVDRETYDREQPGRVNSGDVSIDTVYTGRSQTGSDMGNYYATDLAVRVTKLTRLNDNDYSVTLEHVVPDGVEEFYDASSDLVLRDGMLLQTISDRGVAYEDLATKIVGYLVDRDSLWDNALLRELGSLQLSTSST